MGPSKPAKGLATAEDLRRVADGHAVELVAGEIVEKAAPTPGHGMAQAGLSGALFGFGGASGGPRGPGGWWLMTEVEVFYEDHESYRHDIAGWRREHVPERPTARPIQQRPDWICEILSATNAANDTVRKPRILHRHGVPHYRLLDPAAGTLRVMRWTEEGYLEALTATADETVHAEPFDAIAIHLRDVFGLD